MSFDYVYMSYVHTTVPCPVSLSGTGFWLKNLRVVSSESFGSVRRSLAFTFRHMEVRRARNARESSIPTPPDARQNSSLRDVS